MNRSALRSFGIVLGAAVIALSASPLAASAQTTSTPTVASPTAKLDIVFIGEDEGGMLVDLSAFKGRSSISAAELASGQPDTLADTVTVAQLGGGNE